MHTFLTKHNEAGLSPAKFRITFITKIKLVGIFFETKCPDGFRNVRVHDLKHTFGRRLRSAGVSFEDRQDLLGHKSGRITTHYSEAEIINLIEAANKVCTENSRKSPALTVLRTVSKN